MILKKKLNKKKRQQTIFFIEDVKGGTNNLNT